MSERTRIVIGLLCVVVLVGSAVPVGAQSAPRATVSEVRIAGGGVIDTATPNDATYLWQDEPVNVSVTVADRAADAATSGNYGICLQYRRGETRPRRLTNQCEPLSLPNGANGTREFANVSWPTNATGSQTLVVELRNRTVRGNATVLDRETTPVTVLRKGDDFDGDGLTNVREVEAGYNVSNPDMDSDRLQDGAEVNQYDTNPQRADSDDDGIRDGVEIQRGTDPASADTDGDGLGDGTEYRFGTNPQSDLTPVWLVVGLFVVLGVVVGAFAGLRRGWHRLLGGWSDDGDEGGEPESEGSGPEVDPPPNPEDDRSSDATPEPLTDADRVLELLSEHGGRMKQSRIVAETEWSKAKVSRLLSTMAEEDRVEKLSIGRENIISLDGRLHEGGESQREENASD